MMQIGLISLGAGAASALLFASMASFSVLSIALFYLAPLPILIAALGWTHWAALIAAFGAAVALALVFDSVLFFFAFLAGVGLPAWWLGYLAMLARPSGDGTLEWYPAGRLVLWAAILGALIPLIVIVSQFGLDADAFHALMRSLIERLFPTQGDLLAIAMPPASAVITTLTYVINLWLATKVVTRSGRLQRPWPALPMIELPMAAIVILVAALVVALAGGFATIAGSIVAASMLMALAILGFAVLHVLTRGMDARPFVLTGVYAAVIVFGWPVLGLSLLGIGEIVFHIRNLITRLRGPSAPA
jgi:hypothetical protein